MRRYGQGCFQIEGVFFYALGAFSDAARVFIVGS